MVIEDRENTPRGHFVFLMLQIGGIGANTNAFDPFLADVEAAASLAPADGQLIAFADVAGRSVPELQGNAMPIRSTSVGEKNFAAFGIGARENQLSSRHPDQPSGAIAADPRAVRSRGTSPQRGEPGVKRDIIG
ncbi:MAG: hypothetical protein ACHRXM_04220 [Isosphaerales bacterium]